MKRSSLILTILLFSISTLLAQKNDMQGFVTNLMAKMTLEEKLGQLNLPGAGDITTGQAKSSDIGKKIQEGRSAVFSISNRSPRSAKFKRSPLSKAG